MLEATSAIEPVPPLISSWTRGWGCMHEGVAGTAPNPIAPYINVALYQAIFVPVTCTARRMWWANGDVAGSREAGIYADAGGKPGQRLVTTGSVAATGTFSVQFADITDTVLAPSTYWIYLTNSTDTATSVYGSTPAVYIDELIQFRQTGLAPGSAPATATPEEPSVAMILLYGIDTRGVG